MDLRNIAIIAHVDHGKTTLVDEFLSQSGAFRENQAKVDRAMDSIDLERERGITILAKTTSINFKDCKINIVDTPGHADFGGEVERILSMVDGVILLVDAVEGPMPQTKFVTSKALALGLRPIVVINKVDKKDADPDTALDQVFDLFVNLDANEEQLDFPILYASGRAGWADTNLDGPRANLTPLLEKICEYVPLPTQMQKTNDPFSMLVTILGGDTFLGRVLTGRVESGVLNTGQNLHAMDLNGTIVEKFRVSKIFSTVGLKQQVLETAYAGDIVSISGMTKATVANTLSDLSVQIPIEAQPIDPSTITIGIGINDSPLAGRDGAKVQSRLIRDRLYSEAECNVSINVIDTKNSDTFEVSGRGELQLGILVENMRREGFELSISRPKVVLREIEGKTCEPIEEVTIDVDSEYSGTVIEKLARRKGDLVELRPSGENRSRIVLHIPSRGLIGFNGEFMTDTKGTGILNRLFHAWEPLKGEMPKRQKGVLISMENGFSVAYAIFNLEERGRFFIGAGEDVYQGMILGEHSRDNDLEVNPLKGKKLTNVRASGTDEAVRLTKPISFGIEEAIAYIDHDEIVEVTPNNIRLRKRILDKHERKRQKIAL